MWKEGKRKEFGRKLDGQHKRGLRREQRAAWINIRKRWRAEMELRYTEKGVPHKFDTNVSAALVFDGRGTPRIPVSMVPIADTADSAPISPDKLETMLQVKGQLAGNPIENTCELAGRICYDSLGAGRNSASYWDHIRQVEHHSVLEHAWVTIRIEVHISDEGDFYDALINRRGIVVIRESKDNQNSVLRITANFRAILEFERWTDRKARSAFIHSSFTSINDLLHATLHAAGRERAPLVFPERGFKNLPTSYNILEPANNEERIITLYLSGSRGFSHEQVRHRMNMSQRSTRYCDESSSPYVEHPLITQLRQGELTEEERLTLADAETAKKFDVKAYDALVTVLQAKLTARGVDKVTARKQARGAARGCLGNSLKTELLFTASVEDWKGIIRQRANAAADAEIRIAYTDALQALKSSQYGQEFECFEMQPSPDGIGMIAIEKQETLK